MKEIKVQIPKSEPLWICFTCLGEQELEKQREPIKDGNLVFAVYKCPLCDETQLDPIEELR